MSMAILNRKFIKPNLISGTTVLGTLIPNYPEDPPDTPDYSVERAYSLGEKDIDSLIYIPSPTLIVGDTVASQEAFGVIFEQDGVNVNLVYRRTSSFDMKTRHGLLLEFENVKYAERGILNRNGNSSTTINFGQEVDVNKTLFASTMTSFHSTVNDSRYFKIYSFTEQLSNTSAVVLHDSDINQLYYNLIEFE